MSNETAHNYGKWYWCIGLADSKTTEVYVHADTLEVRPDGSLIAGRNARDADHPAHATLGFAPGRWRWFYAASVIDGHAVAVEHWPGQIAEAAR